MNHYKKSLLCMCMALAVLTSCDKHDDHTPEQLPDQGQDSGQDSGQKPDVNDPEELKLSFILTASIAPEKEDGSTLHHFGTEIQAVALLRSTGDEAPVYIPLTLTRSAENPRQASATRLVDMNGIKANPDTKWQIRLFTGGEWDMQTKQLRFPAPDNLRPTERLSALTFNQPYVSAWQDIPTNEKGQFTTDQNGQTPLSVEVATRAVTLMHHISSCDAASDVEIRQLKLSARALTFGGFYDLSDSNDLKSTDDTLLPEWKPLTDNTATLEVVFETPLTVKVGEETLSDDYLYTWGYPAATEETTVSVSVSGKVGEEEFTDLGIYEAAMPAPRNGVTEILSRLHIPHDPQPVEGPITLSTRSDKNTIVADDTDEVEFVVMQAGVDVTRQCTVIRIENGFFDYELSGHTFKTHRVGRYEFYATKEGERSNHIYITATQQSETDPDGNLISGTRFAKNVTAQSGWYDVNKVGNGTTGADGLLCWAAASSNLLQWWLDDLVKQGHRLPEDLPYGAGSLYRLAIFDTFFNCWTNYMHSTKPAIRWFMEGGGMTHSSNNSATPDKNGTVHEGGYFRGVLSPDKEQELFQSEYVEEIGAYSGWILPSREEKKSMHKIFSELFIRLIDEGATALSIDSHELTAWGYDVADGLITRIYVTNSDDGGNPRLASYKVAERNEDIHLIDYPGKTNQPTQIIRLTCMKAYSF